MFNNAIVHKMNKMFAYIHIKYPRLIIFQALNHFKSLNKFQ